MPSWFKSWESSGCMQGDVATLSCIPVVFLNVLTALLAFAGLTALAMFILGSFKMISAGGDAKKLAGAKNNFKYGTLGLIIVLLSFLIIDIIATVTGVACIKTFGFGCQ